MDNKEWIHSIMRLADSVQPQSPSDEVWDHIFQKINNQKKVPLNRIALWAAGFLILIALNSYGVLKRTSSNNQAPGADQEWSQFQEPSNQLY
jgi:hypothetical protein